MKKHFIHIPKNAGMTIRLCNELKPRITLSGKSNLVSQEYANTLLKTMNKYGEHHGYEHARWRDVKKSLRNGPCFAIVRNPWAKVVSRYTFLIHEIERGAEAVINNPTYIRCSFEEFLEQRQLWVKPYFWHRAIKGWYQQKDHVVDESGNLRCDILRAEELNKDINEYFSVNLKLQSRNVSNTGKKDYKLFYTPLTKKIIEDWYSEDIEFFGFKFDGIATKHIWNRA